VGQTQDQATGTLKGAGLTAAPTTISHCDATNNGNVVNQNPLGGSTADQGSSVAITVCRAATPTVTVPNVVGQTQDQATGTLKGAGLTAAPTTTSDCDGANNGNVVNQDPLGGSTADQGSSVAITVCRAASPTLRAPNLVGQTQDQATAT